VWYFLAASSSLRATRKAKHDDNKTSTTMTDPLSEQMNDIDNQMIHLQIQPTIEISPGTQFYVMLTRNVVLEKSLN
jgi:type IV secretory pathway VirB10-like protein